MSTLRPLKATDLLRMNHINLDYFTENYSIIYYLSYLARHPEYCQVAESFDGSLMGYILGKAEGFGAEFHGHVTALTVAPVYRRLGVGNLCMRHLEAISSLQRANFVDLFVRPSNKAAVEMYRRLGYSLYQTIPEYYSADSSGQPEDGLDMRKRL